MVVEIDKYTLKGSIYKTNWALLILLFIMPLRNIQLQYIPNLGGGLNIVNLLFFISIVHAGINGRKYDTKIGLNSFLTWYIVSSILALIVGYGFLDDKADGNWKRMKDQLIPIFLIFIIQRSAGDMIQWRRIFLACLLPLPYCFKVVWDQYTSVSSWHYSHDLRISGTFMGLGSNEMAAYSVTMALVCLGCVLTCWNDKKYRYVFSVFFMFSGACVLYSYSRGAYIGFILGAAMILLRYRNTAKLIAPIIVILSFGIANLPPSVSERFSSIDAEEGERDESAQSRFVFWGIAFNKFLESPLVGYGYRTVQDSRINPHEMDTHNYYIKMLVERGLVGFITFLLLLRVYWSVIKRNLDWDSDDNIVNGLILGMGGALVALMLGNMFGDRFSHYPIITCFSVFIGLISIIELRRAEGSKFNDEN
ncbi:MAG: O-antigen ligase family protein [Oleispira sp.]|nr:O-antigen ligase family protein [Oleispira sp.]MBL4880073.1 O-antigen ligase family protein [Oleispira sp.]